MKLKIKKDDYVQVMAGEDSGRRGRVLRVYPHLNRAIVEGVNYIFRHTRKTSKASQGGRVQKEAPIAISKLRLYCPHCQAITSAFYAYEQEQTDKGEKAKEPSEAKKVKIRSCKKCKRRI